MKKELENKLYTQFPRLFSRKDLAGSETRMCDGLACDDGWYNLIYEMCRELQDYCDNSNTQIEFEQVKEKFGCLRVYSHKYVPEVGEIISQYESYSSEVCEICGGQEEVSRTKGWIKTLCGKCKRQKKVLY